MGNSEFWTERSKTSTNDSKLSTTGKILIGITGGVALGLSVVCVPFVSPALRKYCLPYIPATDEQLRNVFTALGGRRGSLLDLGSGDGRIVIESAKRGFESHGIELNRWLVYFSRLSALRHGVAARFHRRDLWECHLGGYDNIVIFGVEQMMGALERKARAECRPGSRVVACRFPLPGARPQRTVGSGVDTVWLYRLPQTRP